jgi:hypothetical protein
VLDLVHNTKAYINISIPQALSDQETFKIDEKVKRHPAGFVCVDVRPGDPGGDFLSQGAIKLRSIDEIIDFIANGINVAPEFHVEKDPRTGQFQGNPRVTLQINVTDTKPPNSVPSVKYRGKYCSVADTKWNRSSLVLLSSSFRQPSATLRTSVSRSRYRNSRITLGRTRAWYLFPSSR